MDRKLLMGGTTGNSDSFRSNLSGGTIRKTANLDNERRMRTTVRIAIFDIAAILGVIGNTHTAPTRGISRKVVNIDNNRTADTTGGNVIFDTNGNHGQPLRIGNKGISDSSRFCGFYDSVGRSGSVGTILTSDNPRNNGTSPTIEPSRTLGSTAKFGIALRIGPIVKSRE